MAGVPVTARRPVRARLLLPAATAAVVLAACGEDPLRTRSATAGLPDLKQSLSASGWRLDPGDSSLTSAALDPVTLDLGGGGALRGTAPCNTYRGAVELVGDDGVRVGGLTTTRLSCRPAVTAAEEEYLEALARVRTADVTDPDRLVLTSPGVRLSFTAVERDR